MIDPDAFLALLVKPGCRLLSELARKDMASEPAQVELLAIAIQESGLEYRRQVDSQGNPLSTLARGFWQFEAGGGVAGVMSHPASLPYAQDACMRLYVPWVQDDIHEAIAWNGYLALFFARLLLWTDAAPLPAMGDEQASWNYYQRNWRPGKPNPQAWPANYRLALAAVMEKNGRDNAPPEQPQP
jgi:hypothetical protein